MRPMQHQLVNIHGPAGELEGIYQAGDEQRPAVVVCHPHPLHGGTMRNKVVYWMARTFHRQGCSVLRFNFRGVEGSAGHWDHGRGESDDAAVALNWLADMQPDAPLWLAGFSFGCYAGLQAACRDERIGHTIAVAPAVHMHDYTFFDHAHHRPPCTVIAASEDEIVPFDTLQTWLQQHETTVNSHIIAGAGHFFPNHKDELQARLIAEVAEAL